MQINSNGSALSKTSRNEADMSVLIDDHALANNDTTYNDYLERRKYWESISSENIKILDEQIVFLSSGALVFSIAVADSLGPYYNFQWLCLIWSLFTASLLLRLLSFFTGEKNAAEKIKILDKNIEAHQNRMGIYRHDLQNDTVFQRLTIRLNFLALGLFILGVIAFFPYAIKSSQFKNNQNTETRSIDMSNQKPNEGQQKNSTHTVTYKFGNQGSVAPVQRSGNTTPVATGTRGNPGSTAPIQRPTPPVSPPSTK